MLFYVKTWFALIKLQCKKFNYDGHFGITMYFNVWILTYLFQHFVPSQHNLSFFARYVANSTQFCKFCLITVEIVYAMPIFISIQT